jgi:5-formyltetrahydrofolate cyclo-ligase
MTGSKHDLRLKFGDRRENLSPAALAARSKRISRYILAMPEIRLATTVLAYWPLESRAEIDLRAVIRALRSRGTTIGLPVVAAGDVSRGMSFHVFENEDLLEKGPYNLLQPAPNRPVETPGNTIALVPALAADRTGNRLGYGGGYYDRFLQANRIFSIAAVLASCLVDSLPAEPHDAKVSAVATEVGITRIGAP